MQPVHLLLIFSILFIIIGFSMIRKAKRMRRVGRKAMATVIKNKYRTDNEGSAQHTPVIEFRTEKQELITLEFSYGNTAEPKDIGEKVEILYDPKNPREVALNSFLGMMAGPWLFIIMGVAGLVLASLDLLGITNIVMTQWE